MARPRRLEGLLQAGVFVGIALLLLTPFVVTPETVFPFVVGKALWSRSIIEGVFALWAVLALVQPACRPPRSWLLVLLTVGLAVELLSACFGASVQLGLWSTYERMQGVVGLVHWLALAVVLSSMLRSGAAWRMLLTASVGVGAAMACLIIALHYALDVPFYGGMSEGDLSRVSGPFGNSMFLSTYMLANLMVALGLGLRSWRTAGWRRAIPWAAAVALHFAGVVLAGSAASVAGLFASIGFVSVFYVFLARGRGRWAAAVVLAGLGAGAAGIGMKFVDPDRSAAFLPDNPAARHITTVHLQRPGVQSRLAAWEAGLEGFAERPVLGWGPGNFGAVFARFASGYGSVTQFHDQAHGKIVEVAATAGGVGLAAYLALWTWVFLVAWRAARRGEAEEREVVVFVGAALAGNLVQSQFQFDTITNSLQIILLLSFVAGLEATAFPDSRGPRLPARLSSGCAGLLRRRAVRTALGMAAAAAAAVGLTANQAIYAAANEAYWPDESRPLRSTAGGIESFRPLANSYRWWVFGMIERKWARLRFEDQSRVLHLIEWTAREAEEAARTEPENWQINRSLARMFRAVAATYPQYDAQARRYLARARELAPNRPVFPTALRPPDALAVRRLDDGRRALRWRWPEGAGYVAVKEVAESGPDRYVFHAYDPGQASFVLPEGRPPGRWRYRIKACRYPGACSAWAEWPAAMEPVDGSDSREGTGADMTGGRRDE